jgi:hypothetical protein
MLKTTYTEDAWQVVVSQPVKATRQDRRTGEDIHELVVNVDLVKWGETVILEDAQIAYDWQDRLTGQFAFIHWDGVVYENRVIEEVRQELEDEIKWALQDLVESAVDSQVEYDTEHADSLQNYCDALTGELGYHLHNRQAELIDYLKEGWEVSTAQAIKVIEAIERYDCEGRYSGGFWKPSWNDCFVVNSWCAGEVTIELEWVFQGVSRDEIKQEIGSVHAYGGADGAFYAVVTDEVLEDKVNNVLEEE